ncbi:MAG: hypothetical protein AAGA83_15925 [Cyanobacteria bacterium P01_F01_bin.116]
MTLSIIVGGAITSFIFCLLVLVSWRFTPEAWLSDLTEGKIKSPPTWSTYTVFAVILFTILAGTTITAGWVASVYDASFYERLIVAWLVIVILNVVDLVVIDLLIYTWIYPSWMRVDGIEPLHQPWAHVKAGLVGLVIGVPMAAIAAGLTIFV